MRLAHRGKRAYNWKASRVSYAGMHAWVRRWLGSPKKCEHCGTKKAKIYDWANISKKYLRNLKDWVRLCRPCHRKFDKKNNGKLRY